MPMNAAAVDALAVAEALDPLTQQPMDGVSGGADHRKPSADGRDPEHSNSALAATGQGGGSDSSHLGPGHAQYSASGHVVDQQQQTIDELRRRVSQLDAVLRMNPVMSKQFYTRECVDAMRRTIFFHSVPDNVLEELAGKMQRVVCPRGTFLVEEGSDMKAFVLVSGHVERTADVGGQRRLATTYCTNSIGLLHLYNQQAHSRFSAQCLTEVIAYALDRKVLDEVIARHPELGIAIIKELSWTIRNHSHNISTPLYLQKAAPVSWTAVVVAASMESFYRSALNNLINQKVTGKVGGRYFPDMHVQVPTRVMYISGLKHIRTTLDAIDLGGSSYADLYRTLFCLVPGMMMCPFSSILEATNAGHANPEPLWHRWRRGYVPRMAREVFFAIGINQMSDLLVERVGARVSSNEQVRSAVGSLLAGLTAGYISHVPHVLSTLKLLRPNESYATLWHEVYSRSTPMVHAAFHTETARLVAAQAAAVLFPLGVVRRSFQIGGSFTLINGITYALRDKKWY